MKQKILFSFVMTLLITSTQAQNQKALTGYAITAPEKGQSNWKEVRLLNINTGEVVQPIYQTNQEIPLLNARTGKAIQKKDPAIVPLAEKIAQPSFQAYTIDANNKMVPLPTDANGKIISPNKNDNNSVMILRSSHFTFDRISSDKPFATGSAAIAYDKKHDRLYYTPMNINQLRYIDLKSKTPSINYFEDETFGASTGFGDIGNQITRMVFGSDGNGYALSNSADHLISFSTGKKPVITDLGALTDDVSNGNFSVHSRNGYGGDMVADANNNLYLITANRRVFRISIATKVASYLGNIKGLPQGYNTNGAMVEEGSKVIVCSAESTVGYYRFDLTTMQAEKISSDGNVFNASDLANGNLAFEKKKKEDKNDIIPPVTVPEEIVKTVQAVPEGSISVYPNPASGGTVKLSFSNQPAGNYTVQLTDLSGQTISSTNIALSSKIQVADLKLPDMIAKGTYLIKVISNADKISSVTKLIIQ
ncbi:MAG: T9SS type A sorting domain-containing protein [Ferruginibacter sp.]